MQGGKFTNGLARVGNIYSKYGYINKTGKTVIKFEFEYASDFNNGLAWVKNNGKYGYINTQGQYIWNPVKLVNSLSGINDAAIEKLTTLSYAQKAFQSSYINDIDLDLRMFSVWQMVLPL